MTYIFIDGTLDTEPCPICTNVPCPNPLRCEVICWSWVVLEHQGLTVHWPLGERPTLHLTPTQAAYLTEVWRTH